MARGRQSFLSGAAVLSSAVAITKVLGALYKIPLGNLLGSEGMAHFYAAYNVFNVLVMLCAGMPAAISRVVSQYCALGRRDAARRTFFVGGMLLALLGTTGSVAMYLLAPQLAEFLHDPRAQSAIRALSPALLSMCLCAAVRGYTQGLGDMRPTAVSQVLESAGKLVVGLGACRILLRRGFSADIAASGALWGVGAGGLLALLYLAVKVKHLPRCGMVLSADGKMAGTLLRIAVPITIGAAGMSVLTLLDQALVLRVLRHSLGYSAQQAVTAYGEYTFSMTLFVLAPSLIIPLSSALMPCVSGALAAGREKEAARFAQQALRLAASVGMPVGVGLSCLARPILELLYPAQPQMVPAAAWHLRLLGIAAVFVGLAAVSGGILQAYGKHWVPLAALAAGGGAKVLCDTILVARREIAVRGVSIGTLVCYILIGAIQLQAVRRCSAGAQNPGALLWPSGLGAATMAVAIDSLYGLLLRWLPLPAACLGAVLGGGAVYLILMPALGGFTVPEWKRLLVRIGRRRRFS